MEAINKENRTPTLYQKAIQGGVWVIAARIFQQVLDLARTVILARLLFPRDFGQMALALLCLSFLDTFTKVGISEALVQKKDDVQDYLDTGWTMGMIRGAFIFLVLFLIAPWISVFFDSSGTFTPGDIQDPQQVITNLRDPQHPAYQLVYAEMPESTRTQLDSLSSEDASTETSRAFLAEQFTALAEGELLWSEAASEQLELRQSVAKMLQQRIEQQDTVRANRLILEELFPDSVHAAVLDRQQVTAIIQVVGLCFLIGSMSNIGIIFFRRDLNFGRQFAFQSVGSIVSLVTAVLIAYYYRTVWALAFGKLAGTLSGCIASYFVHPYRPRWRLDFQKIKSLWRFGQHVMWTSTLKFLILKGDDILVGKMYGLSTLGLYRFAYRFSNLAATEIGDVITQITFPTFSRLQDNLEKIKSGYIKATRNMVLLAYPISGGLLALAPEFVMVVLGPKWMAMVPTLRILCILGMTKCQQGDSILYGLGRPDLSVRVSVVRLILIALSIYPLMKSLGMFGAGLSITLSSLVVVPILLWQVQKLVNYRIVDHLRLIAVPLMATAAMTGSLLLIKGNLHLPVFWKFVVLVLMGGIAYTGLILLMSRFNKAYDPTVLWSEIVKGWRKE